MQQFLNHQMNMARQEMGAHNFNFNGAGLQSIGTERFFNPHRIPRGLDPKFKHNLAFYIGQNELSRIGHQLGEQIDEDDAARDKWLQIGLNGMDQLGIGSDRSRPSNNRGNAADIFAPTLLTTGLRVTCKLHSSLFPASGFVETQINGDASEEIDAQAMRIKDFFNYMTTDVMLEYKADKKQQLWWTVNFGSTFTKVFNDHMKGKPVADYIRPEDIIIDQNASALNQAERITHQFILSERELHLKILSNVWRQCSLEQDDIYNSPMREKIGSKIGVQGKPTELDKRYMMQECMTYLDLEGFPHLSKQGKPTGRKLPYIVIKAKESNEIVALYRNWSETDPLFRPLEYLAQHKYFTGFNVYGLGLIHMALGLARSETEIQNQLIKAAQLANAPSLIQQAGLRLEKSRLDISPGSITPVQSFDNNIQNSVKQLEFKDPSPVMLDLKKMQSEAIQNMSIAREIKPENLPTNTAATTVLGILSTMHVLEDSIIGDFYDSFRKEFALLFSTFREWLPEGQPYPFSVPNGSHKIVKEDFSSNIIVRPVMDPNVSAQSMQLIINDTITQLAATNPDLYDQREVQRRLLNSMKISEIDKILKPIPVAPPPPPQLDPVSENGLVAIGKPILAYKAQNHDAHNVVHKAYLQQLSEDESADHSAAIGELQAHINEHDSLNYVVNMEAKLGSALPEDPTQIPPQFQDAIAMKAAKIVQKEQKEALKANPPPIDPNQVLLEELQVKREGNQLKSQQMQQEAQQDATKMQIESQNEQMKAEIEQQRLQLEMQRIESERMKIEMQMQMEQQKLQLEMQMQEQKIQAEMQQKEVQAQIDMAKLELDREKHNEDIQMKSYDSTLRFESNKDNISNEEVDSLKGQ